MKSVKAIVSKSFTLGGKGSENLALEVVESINKSTNSFKPLYQNTDTVMDKINTIATEIYGASSVEYSVKAKSQLKLIQKLGFEDFPICMAKTPASFSDDEKKIGRPTNFDITIREFEIASGAGFLVPLLGEIMRMPGLPSIPNAENIDLDADGNVVGLF